MIMRITTIALLVQFALLLAAPALAQAPTKAEVEAYLGKISDTHGPLNEAGKSFGRLLGPAIQGDPKDQLALYRSYRSMARTLWNVQEEAKELRPPDHPVAREVQAANERFLSYQLEAILLKLPAVLEAVDDASLLPQDKMQRVKEMLMHDNAREVELGKQLRESMTRLRAAAQ
jgi:hypothetical protein